MNPIAHRFVLPRFRWSLAVFLVVMIAVMTLAPGPAKAAERDKVEAFLAVTSNFEATDEVMAQF